MIPASAAYNVRMTSTAALPRRPRGDVGVERDMREAEVARPELPVAGAAGEDQPARLCATFER